jgi:exodeoxyribonuclease VII large subunit
VGHETDFSISDFVADVRAPTPSAAAEMVVPDRKEVRATVATLQGRLGRGLKHIVELLRDELSLFAAHRFFRYPQDIVLTRVQTLDDLGQRLLAAMKDKWSARWMRLERAAGGLARHSPQARWRESAAALKMATFRLRAAARTLLEHRWTVAVSRLAGRLEDLNPDRVLARGYSRTVLECTGRILTRAADAITGDLIRTHLAQGTLCSKVTESNPGNPAGRPGGREPDAGLPVLEKPMARPKKKGRDSGPSLFE